MQIIYWKNVFQKIYPQKENNVESSIKFNRYNKMSPSFRKYEMRMKCVSLLSKQQLNNDWLWFGLWHSDELQVARVLKWFERMRSLSLFNKLVYSDWNTENVYP